jgi:ABC-type bacteriocin/lantibiotic exporter with double-glycine peptidase domain
MNFIKNLFPTITYLIRLCIQHRLRSVLLWFLIISSVSSTLDALSLLSVPILISKIMGASIPSSPITDIFSSASLFVIVIVFGGLLSVSTISRFLTLFFSLRFSLLLAKRVSVSTLQQSLTLNPSSFYSHYNCGSFVNTLSNDSYLAIFRSTNALFALSNALLIVFSTGFAIVIYSPATLSILFVFSVLTLTLVLISNRWSLILSRRVLSLRDQLLQSLTCIFSSYRDITVYKLRDHFISSHLDTLQRYNIQSLFGHTLAHCPKMLIELSFWALFTLITSLLVYRNGSLQSTFLPTLGLILFSFQKLLPAFMSLYTTTFQLEAESAEVRRVASIYKVPHDIYTHPSSTSAKSLTTPKHFPTFFIRDHRSLRSSLPGSLSFDQSRIFALEGSSGSGKSTFLDTLCGFEDRALFSIRTSPLDSSTNSDNASYALKSLGFAYVSQSPKLIGDHLSFNIACTYQNIDHDLFSTVCQISEVEIPGYLTPTPDLNIQAIESPLSGGQLQRITLARAIYSLPSFLLLDEAFSAVREDQQQRILANIISFLPSTVIFFSTHNRSLLSLAHKVLSFD